MLDRLSDVGQDRLAAAMCLAAGLEALASLAERIDPNGERSSWDIAGEVETRLRRFEGTSWVRIRRGGREPVGPLEKSLAAISACPCLPRSQRNIHALLG